VPDEAVVRELSDQVWERVLTRDPVAAQRCGRPVDALPRGGPGELAENVAFAAAMLGKLAGIAGLQAAFLRDHLEHELAEEQRFWYRLPVTPYNSMVLSSYREDVFAAAELRTAHDVDRYLKLLDDYAAVVEQLAETMAGQRRRGIRLPGWAVPTAIATVSGHADASSGLLVPPARRAGLAPGGAAGGGVPAAARRPGGRRARRRRRHRHRAVPRRRRLLHRADQAAHRPGPRRRRGPRDRPGRSRPDHRTHQG
jgi:hypothetical protein